MPAGYIPTAVATADFNGDGNPDFVIANGGDNTLWFYFGKGDGTFQLLRNRHNTQNAQKRRIEGANLCNRPLSGIDQYTNQWGGQISADS
jgi:hypothetical protein